MSSTGCARNWRRCPAATTRTWLSPNGWRTCPAARTGPCVEPNNLEGIWAECDPERPLGAITAIDAADSARRVEAAFLGRVAGCILGKPLEIQYTLEKIWAALEPIGEWPLDDYVSERIREALPRPLHLSWTETVREQIRYVGSDNDLNYTVLGMLLLEQHGLDFSQGQIGDLWLQNLPIWITFGPERFLCVQPEAIRAYERALALLGEQDADEQAPRTLMKLGLTYELAFDCARGRQAHEEGFALWQRRQRHHSLCPSHPMPCASIGLNHQRWIPPWLITRRHLRWSTPFCRLFCQDVVIDPH
jgi:hypothetical protein